MSVKLRGYGPALVSAGTLAAVLLVAVILGATGRSPARGEREIVTRGTRDTFAAFIRGGVRGRILVVFDDRSNISERNTDYRRFLPDAETAVLPPDPVSLTSALIAEGVARRVVVVLPDARWREANEGLEASWEAFPDRSGHRRRFAGAPVTFVPASRAEPPSGERVIVLVSEDSGEYPPGLLADFTSPAVADLVVRNGGG